MADTDSIQWKLLDTDMLTGLSDLPADSSHLYIELNEPGSGELRIPILAPAAALISSGQFVRASYRGAIRGGFFIENIEQIHADEGEGGNQWLKISGRGSLAYLADAAILPDGTSDTTRTFSAQTKGQILKTLINEAIADGELTLLDIDFSNTLDSNGDAWTDSETLDLVVGTKLLDIIRDFAGLGLEFSIDLETTGRFTLHAYKTAIGTDKSSIVYFRVGSDVLDGRNTEVGGEIENSIIVKHPSGFTRVSDAISIAARRKRVGFVNASEAGNITMANTIGNAKLSSSKDPQEETFVKISDEVAPYAFLDYVLGDTVTVDKSGVQESIRIRGMQLTWTGNNYAEVGISNNNLATENRIRLMNRVSALERLFLTAHDAGLLETQFWASIGRPGDAITSINAMVILGDYLYVAGDFDRIGGVDTSLIARYNLATSQWSPLGGNLTGTEANCLAVYGTNIIVGGRFYVTDLDPVDNVSLGIWNTVTEQWDAPTDFSIFNFGNPVDHVYGLAVTGDDLYVVGRFDQVQAVANTYNIAKYDLVGETWAAVGTGLGSGATDVAYCCMIKGSFLYIGGDFTNAGGLGAAADHIIRRNISTNTWFALDTGLDDIVYALAEYGNYVVVGGAFTDYGGVIAQWDTVGTAWSAHGLVLNDSVYALTVSGGDLYAGGAFTEGIQKWDGGTQSSLTTGTNDDVYAIIVDDLNIYCGGIFTVAGDVYAQVAVYMTSFVEVANFLATHGAAYDLAQDIHAATAKSSLDNADEFGLWDSVSRLLRKVTWANIKATLKTYFDTLYVSLTSANWVDLTDGGATTLHSHAGGGGTPGGADTQIQYNDGGSFNGDDKLLWDKVNEVLSVGGLPPGGTTPGETNLVGADAASQVLQQWIFGTSVNASIAGMAARGTKASPTAIQSGDIIYRMRGRGMDDSTYSNTQIEIEFVATENWDTTHHGTKINFYITPNASTTKTLAMTINQDGTIQLPIGKTVTVNGVEYVLAKLASAINAADNDSIQTDDKIPLRKNFDGLLGYVNFAGLISAIRSEEGGEWPRYPFNARLTLETGVPISTTAQTAKTTLYLTPYAGNQVALYDGGTQWIRRVMAADVSLSLAGLGRSQAYTNDPAAGSNITLNMTNTAGFLVGQKVKVSSSAGSEEARITTVTLNTSIVVDALALNHTTTSPLVTGMLPYDIFLYDDAGTLTLEAVAWTNLTTRATAIAMQNGVQVKTGDTTHRLVGTILTTLTVGQCEFSPTHMGVSNLYNKLQYGLYNCPGYNDNNANNSYTVSATSWAEGNGNARIYFVLCEPQSLSFMAQVVSSPGASSYVLVAMGFDTSSDAKARAWSATGIFAPMTAFNNNNGLPLAVGGHFVSLLFMKSGANNGTVFADEQKSGGSLTDPAETFYQSTILC